MELFFFNRYIQGGNITKSRYCNGRKFIPAIFKMENKSAFCNLYRCIVIELKDELEAAHTKLDSLA